jgi:hypothetical protein
MSVKRVGVFGWTGWNEKANCKSACVFFTSYSHFSSPHKQNTEEVRQIRVPPHRFTPLKKNWEHIMKPIVEHLKLQIRMNTKLRCVEVKVSEHTVDNGAIQKACDFVQAFMMGFEVQDAIALLRLDDLFVGTILLAWLMLKISLTLRLPRSNHPTPRNISGHRRENAQGGPPQPCYRPRRRARRKDAFCH